MNPVADRVVIVTGSSAGIGLALGERLAREGARVVLCGRNPERLARAVGKTRAAAPQASVEGVEGDVRNAADMARLAQRCLALHGRIDALVTCAGILRPPGGRISQLRDTSLADWNEIMDVNLKGVFLSNRAVLAAMTSAHRGQIINLSSTSALRGHAFDAAYCASKFAVLGLTEALAEEVGRHNIRVHAVLPGATESEIWDQNGPIPKPKHVLPVARMVDAILYLLTLPEETTLPRLVVEPPPSTAPSAAWLRSGAAH